MLKFCIRIGLVFCGVVSAQRLEPFPVCLSCIPQALLDAPGIGFDFEVSYATIAVRFNNGSNVNIAKVDGNEDYKALMRRMMGAPDPTNPNQQITTHEGLLGYSSKDTTNSINPTADIEILSTMIALLKTTTEKHLYTPISLALATHPSLPHLSQEILEAAFERTNITHLRHYKVITRLDSIHNSITSLAALGYGICEHWNDNRVCEEEDGSLEWKNVLSVSFTDERLVVGISSIKGPHWYRGPDEIAYWDLGFEEMKDNPAGKREGIGESIFRDKIREAIEHLPISSSKQKPNLLLILGNSSSEPKFRGTLISALEKMELSHLYPEWERRQIDPLYGAAKGAAEIAKIWQGSEWNCIQRESCVNERPKDDGEGVGVREMWDKRARWEESCKKGECPWDERGHSEL